MGKTEQVFKISNLSNVYYVLSYQVEWDYGTSHLDGIADWWTSGPDGYEHHCGELVIQGTYAIEKLNLPEGTLREN